MRIRNYANSDLDVCRLLWTEMVQKHQDIYDDPSIGGNDPGLEFDQHLDLVGSENVWVIEIENEVVGLTALILKDQEAEIEPVIVSYKHRDKGVGRRLVEYAIEEAKRLNLFLISVKPAARNKEAISFFYNCGFRTIGHIQQFIWIGESQPNTWKDGLQIFEKKFKY